MNEFVIVSIGYFNILNASHHRHFKLLSQRGKVVVAIYNDELNTERYGSNSVGLIDRIECLRSSKYISEIIVTDKNHLAVSECGATLFGGHETEEMKGEEINLKNSFISVTANESNYKSVGEKAPFKGFLSNDVFIPHHQNETQSFEHESNSNESHYCKVEKRPQTPFWLG